MIAILLGILKLGIGTSVFGVALMKVFEKCELSKTKALIPFYNLWVWLKLTKNPRWLLLVLLQWYIIPNAFVYGATAMVLLKLLFDTQLLFDKVSNKNAKFILGGLGVMILQGLLPGLIASVFTNEPGEVLELGVWIAHGFNAAVLLYVFALLFKAGNSALPWDKEKYFSKEFRFILYAKTQFKKNKAALISVYLLGFMVFVGIFANYIANDQPIYAEYHGKTFYPAYTTYINPTYTDSVQLESGEWEYLQFDILSWKQLKLDNVVWALIPYSSETMDEYNANFKGPGDDQLHLNPEGDFVDSPGKFRHKMGTDNLGRDLAAGLIHGTKISLGVGIISMGIASLIGILLGAMAGFYGDSRYEAPRVKYIFAVLGIVLGFFYGFMVRSYTVSEAFDRGIEEGFMAFGFNFVVFFAVLFFMTFISRFLAFGWLGKRITVPVDSIISRSIEILNSIPRLLLIITIAAIVEERSLILLMVIIGFTSWTGIARFTRAELLKIRELEYVQASKALGFKDLRVIFKHALPNALAPVFVAIAFGIASAILIESGLSFLGIGVPDETVTWGSLLSSGRQQVEAWWMVIFPGIAIFLTVTVYNLIGEGLRDALDPRLKK